METTTPITAPTGLVPKIAAMKPTVVIDERTICRSLIFPRRLRRALVHRRNFNRRPDVTSTDGRVDGGCAIHRDVFNLPGLFPPELSNDHEGRAVRIRSMDCLLVHCDGRDGLSACLRAGKHHRVKLFLRDA